MLENQFSRQGFRGFFISLVVIVLATSAMAISTNYQYPEHPACSGSLGAGFPFLFLCDEGSGGSPIDSWGKIDLADVFNRGIRPAGFLVDFLFYYALVWLLGFIVFRITHIDLDRRNIW